MRFKFWLAENDLYNQMMRRYEQEWEKKLLQNPQVQKELEENGSIKYSTAYRVLGVSEGESNFAANFFNQRHRNTEGEQRANQRWRDEIADQQQDEYYYHVTLRTRLRKIKRQGLRPESEPVFSNYTGHSRGKIFLTDKGGVNFWKERVAAHEQHNTDNPQGVVVLRIPKSAVPDVAVDQPGTEDSKNSSYYTTNPIDPADIDLLSQA